MMYSKNDYALKPIHAFYAATELREGYFSENNQATEKIPENTADLFKDPAAMLRLLADNIDGLMKENLGSHVAEILEGIAVMVNQHPLNNKTIYERLVADGEISHPWTK